MRLKILVLMVVVIIARYWQVDSVVVQGYGREHYLGILNGSLLLNIQRLGISRVMLLLSEHLVV